MQLSSEYGLALDPDEFIENLSVGLEQRVEIVKVLYRGAKILILDEPTGVLTPPEVRELFAILRALRDAGRTIIFITHKLEEVLELADRITVMRDGRVTGVVPAAGTTKEQLARMMVGRDVLLRVTREESTPGDPVLQVRRLSAARPQGLARARRGRPRGAGAARSWASPASRATARPNWSRCSRVSGRRRPAPSRSAAARRRTGAPRQVRDLGVAHIPEDRQARGLVLGLHDRGEPGPGQASPPAVLQTRVALARRHPRSRGASHRGARPQAGGSGRRRRTPVGRQSAEAHRGPRVRRRPRASRSPRSPPRRRHRRDRVRSHQPSSDEGQRRRRCC